MALRIQINCYCDYKCDCEPIPETKVTKEQIAYNLMRCNPALARYFSNTLSTTETVIDRKQTKRDSPKPYKSIVDEKNMNILLADKYPPPLIEVPQKTNDVVEIKINNFFDTYAQTSPRNLPGDKPKPKPKKDPTEQEIRQYYRELKQTSRYLPNTAFKKYFNRPIFENYGRENTKGTNDGIIYGNYLKTHNINPHLGENRPHDQQTFYHALISASPEKFLGPKAANIVEQQKGKNLSLTRLKENESIQKPIKRHDNNTDAIIMDNIHQHAKLNNLSQTKLSPKSKHSPKHIKIGQNNFGPQKPSPKNVSKSPKAKQVKSPQSISSHYVNQIQHIQPVRPTTNIKQTNNYQESPRNNLKSKQEMNKMSPIKTFQKPYSTKNIQINDVNQKVSDKCPVLEIRENHLEHILSKNCNEKKSPQNISKAIQKSAIKKTIEKLNFGPGSPQSCVCGSGQQKGEGKCQCLLTKVKTELKKIAQKDVDLNNRLITSARKSALYKNFALNNGQNAKLNPHNYTPCCGQIYQK